MNTSVKNIWIVGYWRCGTNWVTTLLKPIVSRVIADSDVTNNDDIITFRTDYPKLVFIKEGLYKLKRLKSFACKVNCLRYKEANVLLNIFPDSKFINVIRNDDAVIDSIVSARKTSFPVRNFHFGVDEAINFINEWKGEHKYFDNALFKKRTYKIRYEDLVQDFESCYKSLCNYIGVFDSSFFDQVDFPRGR